MNTPSARNADQLPGRMDLPADDPRTLFTLHGKALRAAHYSTNAYGDTWVWCVYRTVQGRDFKRGRGTWLTLDHSMERYPGADGTDIARYIRELMAQA